MAVDPVCKMELDEETTQYVSEYKYKGKKYYFYASLCRKVLCITYFHQKFHFFKISVI